MTADGDDHENDPLMRSMRSVWLDMRDEDPPSRGFSELMAAARVKAVEMKPEPWWRRAFASLVRPPMLAAATVVVLIGSTVVLTRRSGTDAVQSPVVESGLRERPEAEKLEIRDDKDQFAGDRSKPAVAASAGSGQVPRPVIRRPAVVKPDPKKDAKPDLEPPPTIEAVKVPAGNDIVVKGSEDDGRGGRVGTKQVGESAPEEPPVAADSISGTRPSAPTGTRPLATDKPTEAVSAQQLLKQAETAASRKDCPAVRATVARLRKIDEKIYKDRAVTQPAIKRCL